MPKQWEVGIEHSLGCPVRTERTVPCNGARRRVYEAPEDASAALCDDGSHIALLVQRNGANQPPRTRCKGRRHAPMAGVGQRRSMSREATAPRRETPPSCCPWARRGAHALPSPRSAQLNAASQQVIPPTEQTVVAVDRVTTASPSERVT